MSWGSCDPKGTLANRRTSEMSSDNPAQRADSFLRVYSETQHRLSAFVHTLVPNWADAEELLQDIALILWKKFDDFDTSTQFFRWAAKIAQYEVLNYRRKLSRDKLFLDDDVVERLAVTARETSTDILLRSEALSNCLRSLPPRQREIVRLRYRHGGSVAAVAESLNRSRGAIHKSLQKIREQLLRCVRLRMAHPH
jgi:RNA polymerase sigma-70 factor (ECF subfamily)